MEPHKFSARIPNFQEVLPLIELHNHGVYLVNGVPAPTADVPEQEARKATMAWRILQAHNISGDPKHRSKKNRDKRRTDGIIRNGTLSENINKFFTQKRICQRIKNIFGE